MYRILFLLFSLTCFCQTTPVSCINIGQGIQELYYVLGQEENEKIANISALEEYTDGEHGSGEIHVEMFICDSYRLKNCKFYFYEGKLCGFETNLDKKQLKSMKLWRFNKNSYKIYKNNKIILEFFDKTSYKKFKELKKINSEIIN